jgi:uncharacterized protein YxeA
MKKIIIILLGVLLFTSCLKEEVPFSCTIYGKVTESKAPYAPLQRVRVEIENGTPTYTDNQGNYAILIPNLENREYSIEFYLDGYERDYTNTYKLNRAKEEVNFQLTKID